MAFTFGSARNKSTALIGVDISSSSIRIIHLEADGKDLKVMAYASASLKKDAVVNGVFEKIEWVAEGLEKCLIRSGAKLRQAAMAVPNSAVTSRSLVFPDDLSEQAIYEQIEAEANIHFPFPPEEARFDFCKLGSNKGNASDSDVALVVAKREQVDARVNAAEAVGLTPVVMDVESFCVQRSIAHAVRSMPKAGKGLILAHLDIGATNTRLTVIQDNEILFERDQSFGGQQLTQSIAKAYSLSAEDAERKKRIADLPADYSSRVLKPFLQNAGQVAARSLQFFYTSTPFGRVDQLMLAGGSTPVPGLTDAITQATQVPVVIFNPIKGFSVHSRVNRRQLEQDGPALTVACGLALRAFTQNT